MHLIKKSVDSFLVNVDIMLKVEPLFILHVATEQIEVTDFFKVNFGSDLFRVNGEGVGNGQLNRVARLWNRW